jgi:hypothetical protein
MANITKRLVDALKASSDADLVVFDDELRGFGVRLKPSGAVSFIVQYRNAHRRSRRLTLGRFPATTVEAARTRALATLAAVDAGGDPAEVRAARLSAPPRQTLRRSTSSGTRGRRRSQAPPRSTSTIFAAMCSPPRSPRSA